MAQCVLLINSAMRKMILAMSALAVLVGMTGCNDGQKAANAPLRQEKELLNEAIKQHSQEVQSVELQGNKVIYTQIVDGIVDVKTYEFVDNVCVEVERVYVFPNQMSAYRHYRRAIEQAELYNDIQLFKNKVKYDLKKEQFELETKGLTPEQLKEKFDAHIASAKADWEQHCSKKGKCCK